MKTKLFIVIVCALCVCGGNAYAAKKTFEREYTYQGGEADSKLSARAIATTEMRNSLLREVGEFLHSERKSADGEYSEKIEAITAGIVEMKVLNEQWDGNTYRFYIKAQMSVDPAEVNKRIAEVLNDKQKTKELEESRKKTKEAEAEVERLRKELAKSKNNQTLQTAYQQQTEKLSTEEYRTKAYNAISNEWYDLAIEYYQKVIEIDPDFGTYNNIGLAYHHRENYAQAIKYYQKALEIDPKSAPVYGNMGNAYAFQGNYTQAIKCYQKALEIDPDDTSVYHNMGGAYYKQKNYTQAIKCYQKALENDPNDADTHRNMGNAYGGQGNNTQALKCFRKAAQLGDGDAQEFLINNGYRW
ncbi:hypothetical protein FACS189456_5210 [Bacteroidia bacterium]|nr:hypothetical protein FACS189456_5210 [Bacteroidia bacterium]